MAQLNKRVFWVVLDSLGIGETVDSAEFGDAGSNTFKALVDTKLLKIPNLNKLGFSNIDVVNYKARKNPLGCYACVQEVSNGKDSAVGHFEMIGEITKKPYPLFPNGFPPECVKKLEKAFGAKILCNKPYSGTEVIKDYGKQSIKEKKPIVYTSGDSVLQIATHESVFSVDELYSMCEKARAIMQGEWGVNRIIARPFIGEWPYTRSDMRKDFALPPHTETALDILKKNKIDVIGVGKIYDIFAGKGITKHIPAHNNHEVGDVMLKLQKQEFNGLAFFNFNDFDSKYGHRNNAEGYARALNEFDMVLGEFLANMGQKDILIITADHGNDPATISTDHSRELVPLLVYGKCLRHNVDMGRIVGMYNTSATVLDMFNLKANMGESFLSNITKSR